MALTSQQKLLQAIEADDIYAFDALMETAQCGRYRLGRFPVLSLLYLYDARKIISAYEHELISISEWEQKSEPASILKLFTEKAGKCLRLYRDTVVSPPEMLLILDKRKRLKKLYPLFNPSEAVKARLKSIYFVKYALGVRFEDGNIILDRRPLSRKQKKKLFAVVAGCFLAAAAVVTVPVVTVSYIRGHEGDVTSLSQIDFSAKTTYTLKNDITVPENFSVGRVNCSIVGGGHKIVVGKNASLGELNGRLSNVKIETFGNPIFTVCAANSALSAVTVNVSADVQTTDSSAFVAITNYGSLSGVTLNVSGKLSAVGVDTDDTDSPDNTVDLVFGGLVMTNAYTNNSKYGTIKNCKVHYSDFLLYGQIKANATFGGIAGVNNGVVRDCTVTGEIIADTFDLGGVCYINNNLVSGSLNGANLSQTSDNDDWSPIVGGIAVENQSTVEYCTNTGDIAVVGSDLAICGGIVARIYGQSNYCMSSGDITVTAKTAYAGGIYGISQVAYDGYYIYLGAANYCISRGNINATLGAGASCVGGIGGLVQESQYSQFVYVGGGATNCVFMGGIRGDINYFGNIVGVCGICI